MKYNQDEAVLMENVSADNFPVSLTGGNTLVDARLLALRTAAKNLILDGDGLRV